MKISLLHNPDAGDGFSFDEVRREIEGAGHELVQEIDKDSEFERAGEGGVELIVVAGGDGTVRRAVRALHGAGLPFAILPFGTANNVAGALGIGGSMRELTRRWERGRRVPFDLGIARGKWGERRFLEGVGIRLIPEFIRTAEDRLEGETEKGAETELEIARRVFRETVALLKPQRCSFIADGDRLEGDFLLVEVLNIPSIGPKLALLPAADPSDGLLDLVMAGEDARDELFELLQHTPAEGSPRLPTRRVRHVEILQSGKLQIDDEVRDPGEGAVSIGVEAGKVEFLV